MITFCLICFTQRPKFFGIRVVQKLWAKTELRIPRNLFHVHILHEMELTLFSGLSFFFPLFLIVRFYLSYLELNRRLIPSLFFFHTKFDQVLLLKLEFFILFFAVAFDRQMFDAFFLFNQSGALRKRVWGLLLKVIKDLRSVL